MQKTPKENDTEFLKTKGGGSLKKKEGRMVPGILRDKNPRRNGGISQKDVMGN